MGERVIERILGNREAVGVSELARKLAVHRESTRRAIRRGRLGAVKVGGVWRVPRDALAGYLEASALAGRGAGRLLTPRLGDWPDDDAPPPDERPVDDTFPPGEAVPF